MTSLLTSWAKNSSKSSESRDDDSLDDDTTRTSGLSMPSLVHLGSDSSSASTDNHYVADNKESIGLPPGATEFHVEGLELLEESSFNGPETNVSMYSNNSEQSSNYLPEFEDCTRVNRRGRHVEVQNFFPSGFRKP